jgi:cytochrome P450
VRLGPNELSFSSAKTFKTIYGGVNKENPRFIKSLWYDVPGQEPGIANERDPSRHSEVRRTLSHAFSSKSLNLQENILVKYIDLFVSQLKKHGPRQTIPMQEWYNWLTFDIIGDLAFGEPFGAVAEGNVAVPKNYQQQYG